MRRAVVVLLLALAGLAGCTAASPPSGSQALTPAGPCTAGQVTPAVVGEDAGASNRYATLRLTARPGARCVLASAVDVGLRGGDLAVRHQDGPGGTVTLDAAHAATATLHWTVAGDRVATPQALTVALAGGPAEIPWTFGPIDDSSSERGLEVGPLTVGG